ncbi:MAG: inositol monophosphatase family protein [Planctomycetota bacterium]|jgi:myo-inositol-1(or 4)-monophosphatase
MLETAVRAAKAAGEIQKKHFGEILQVDEKDRFDIKLQVDKLCEEKIIEIISEKFPGHAILGEESGASGSSENCWVIDPLDGTVNFFYGVPSFCCSIGLEIKGEPHIGVIYNPCCDELFTAEKGKGAFLNGKRITVSDVSEIDQCMVAIGFMKDENTITAAVEAIDRSIREIFKIRCMGSAALDMAYIAAGRFTGYYECGIRNWDISAGKALLAEAGGKFIEKRVNETTVNIFAGNTNAFDKMAPYFPVDI